jgi:hypothetical protein
VRLHCRIVHKYSLLLLTAACRPLLAIPSRRPVAGASCARKFRVGILRTSYRPPEGLPARRSAGLRGGCGVLCLVHFARVLYDRDLTRYYILQCRYRGRWVFLISRLTSKLKSGATAVTAAFGHVLPERHDLPLQHERGFVWNELCSERPSTPRSRVSNADAGTYLRLCLPARFFCSRAPSDLWWRGGEWRGEWRAGGGSGASGQGRGWCGGRCV